MTRAYFVDQEEGNATDKRGVVAPTSSSAVPLFLQSRFYFKVILPWCYVLETGKPTGVVKMRLADCISKYSSISLSPVTSTQRKPNSQNFLDQSLKRSLHNAFMGATKVEKTKATIQHIDLTHRNMNHQVTESYLL